MAINEARFAVGPYGFDPLEPRAIDTFTRLDLESPDLAALDDAKIIAGPGDPRDRPRWRELLHRWRAEAEARHRIDRSGYEDPAGSWAQSCHAVAQLWLWDELLYDAEQGQFTPDRLLADAERFGGFDGIVLWHAYPVIGIDQRNQWDFYAQVPGLAGLVAALQEAGIAVFVDYNPWDVGTRRDGSDADELTKLIIELGADGVFLDTLREGDQELITALERARPGIGLETESKLPLPRIAEHRLSWAQWFADSPVPGVLRTRWFEPRHQQHHVRRWHRDHAEELQSAFLNGVGVMVWEVVFGVWVGWSARDAATCARTTAIQRAASAWFRAGEWTPLAPLADEAEAARVYASAYTLAGTTLYAVINRGGTDYRGPVLPSTPGTRVIELTGSTVPAAGIAAWLALEPDADEPDWVEPLRGELAGLPHVADGRFPYRTARRLPVPPSTGSPETPAVVLPAGDHRLTVRYRMRETGLYDEAPFVDEWKPLPPRLHDQRSTERLLHLDHPVAVAEVEVTAAELARFRGDSAEVSPEERPATGVDLVEARAYAASVGARLPTEDEWQLAARLAGPRWRRLSPRVWNWTESEHTDGRTRFVILKGGSDHAATGSEWYFDGGVREPEFSAKLLRQGFGLDASPSIGFRLAWDLEDA
ncbi:SUMF1/EgtB/PvdO family nonheme iron enzyme [Microlunatus speluncae]|uniref:SUMF1/EgtB/PvdO family nonheme iron enzyme n=1 Tax=Microlunatus speluncae TaxID=2594267 RepID=UPI0012663F14|nr:SUMF1/EgtB/PvdO family nonheme iron enzyme [Microlunatus speluncae]